jgi:SAM-dependent methyltransferase
MSVLRSWKQRFHWSIAKTFAPRRLEPEIPSPRLNYNQAAAGNLSEYISGFKQNACAKELPFLMDLGLRRDSVLFDYGCGLGRLAYAASKYMNDRGRYVGHEPNMRALAFLQRAYAERANFQFFGDPLPVEEDYIAVHSGESRTGGKKSIDILPQEYLDRIVDIQYSSSVLTHMWLDSISRLLENLNSVVKPDGLCVNTWLIVDEFAQYALDCGIADRALPFKVNRAMTTSTRNPLMCTAYEYADVVKVYEQAGHVIVKTLWGSWSGRGNGVHYQDIVVSRPRA